MAKTTVVCLAYNHRNVLKQCLDSILAQDNIDDVEIIVHDDASTDGTRDIIEKYHSTFPAIIKPILQFENQYSKGVNIFLEFVVPNIRTEFVAFCEGDDFWVDNSKLSRQISALTCNPSAQLCFHSTKKFDHRKKSFCGQSQSVYGSTSRQVKPFEFIVKGSGSIATNSMLIRSEVLIQEVEKFQRAPTLDYYLKLSGFFEGRSAWFIPRVMAAYRVNNDQSWSGRIKNASAADLRRLQSKHFEIHQLILSRLGKGATILSAIRLSIYIIGLALKSSNKNSLTKSLLSLVASLSKIVMIILFFQTAKRK